MSDTVITLGNVAPHRAAVPDVRTTAPSEVVSLHPLVHNQTDIVIPATHDHDQIMREIQNLWVHHSAQAASWVTISTGNGLDWAKTLEERVRDHFGLTHPQGPTMLLTNAGLDYGAKQLGGVATSSVAKYIAITANSTTPGASDTTLTGEITTAGGGLVRAAGVYAHTTSASTYTLSNTFTANSSDTLPVTIAKAGLFDASSSGNLVFESLLASTVALTASGDNVPLIWTITL